MFDYLPFERHAAGDKRRRLQLFDQVARALAELLTDRVLRIRRHVVDEADETLDEAIDDVGVEKPWSAF